MTIRYCPAHSRHYDTRWGCSACPDELDAILVHVLRREDARVATAPAYGMHFVAEDHDASTGTWPARNALFTASAPGGQIVEVSGRKAVRFGPDPEKPQGGGGE